MKRTVQLFLLLAGGVFALSAFTDEKDQAKKPKVKPKPIPVYLGNSNIDSGMVAKPLFDSLLKQGFTARDSNGRVFEVKSFMFTFCERMLYEDSIGNPLFMTDYLSEYNFDNKLKDYQLNALLDRTKGGDTLIIEQIKLVAADTTKAEALGKQLRVVITR